ncbi:Translin family protein [Candida albicans]|uniref:Translin family protein n=1 Tax=Candida albicans TaxID=5476 RepID=A0A8H6F532_CANAX|nr:Translin family protein [Candida albicans]
MSDFASTIFIPARDNLRIKQDDREEVIRLCRDITSYSKKGIFSLHRTISEDELIKELAGYFNVLSDRLAKIQKNYPENMHLRGTISGAVEELIEFFTFAFYKYNFQLLRYDVFLKMIQILINADYLMGIFDCTGEIMRMCISQSSQSTGDFELKATLNNYRFLQKLYDQYVLLTQHYSGISINRGVFDDSANSRGNISFTKKLQVFESSLKKIESTLLDILVSDKEII